MFLALLFLALLFLALLFLALLFLALLTFLWLEEFSGDSVPAAGLGGRDCQTCLVAFGL